MLAAIGRFSIRYRWFVVVGWVVLTAACVTALPSLGSVINNDNASFLPASAPSVKAAKLAHQFQSRTQATAILVAARDGAPLTAGDQAAIGAVEAKARQVCSVASVRDQAVSADGRARTALIQFDLLPSNGGPKAARAVAALRRIVSSGAEPGLSMHLTGSLPVLVDQQGAASHTVSVASSLSVILILALLALAFRSFLAPPVTLLPAGLALLLSEPLIASSTAIGVQISSLLQILLTVLVLGAGTDYGLFLVFRYREGLRAGLEPRQALLVAITKVGQSITFSAATVIAALLTLLLAGFGLYKGVGPGLAIGVAVVLGVCLTFLPALLALLGRAVFWPAVPRRGPPRLGAWGAVASRVSKHPVPTLVAGLVVFGGLAVSLVSYAPSGFNSGGAIRSSDSAEGVAVLLSHFPASEVNPTTIVFRMPTSVWKNPQVIDAAQDELSASQPFYSVTGALDANGDRVSPRQIAYAYRRLGPPSRLPVSVPPGARVSNRLYQAYRSTQQFVSPDGRTLQFYVALRAGSPTTTAALQAIPRGRAVGSSVASSIHAVQSGVAGVAPAAADVASIAGQDIVRVMPVVFAALALLLAIVLRSLLSPLYLVASVGLSYVASLGFAVLIFVVLDNQPGLNFTLPFFMFVFIMALGEDYNILVMSRIREEAARSPIREAVPRAIGSTGTTVTSAGLILAGTFGVLAVAANGQVRQIGTGLALGILLDTFVVRTLLVPSAAVLLGRWNWWPSRMWRADRRSLPERSAPATSEPDQWSEPRSPV